MKFTLKENNAGGFLLSMTENERTEMLQDWRAETAADWLRWLHGCTSLERMTEVFTHDLVADDDIATYADEWKDCKVIADNGGLYPEKACVSGTEVLHMLHLMSEPLAYLRTFETAEQVKSLAVQFASTIMADLNDYDRHDMAYHICRLIYDKSDTDTGEALQSVACLWDEVCREMVYADGVELTFWQDDDDNNSEQVDTLEEADWAVLYCDRVDLRGIRPYYLSEDLARLISGNVLRKCEEEQDGNSSWFSYVKA